MQLLVPRIIFYANSTNKYVLDQITVSQTNNCYCKIYIRISIFVQEKYILQFSLSDLQFYVERFILENLKERFIKITINYKMHLPSTKMYFQYVSNCGLTWIVLWCLTSLLPIFQLYRVSQFCWWGKPEYPAKTTCLPKVTDKLDHIMLYRLSPPEWDSYSELGDGYWFHSKSSYHTITITTALLKNFNELLIKIIINYKLHLPSNKMYLQ